MFGAVGGHILPCRGGLERQHTTWAAKLLVKQVYNTPNFRVARPPSERRLVDAK